MDNLNPNMPGLQPRAAPQPAPAPRTVEDLIYKTMPKPDGSVFVKSTPAPAFSQQEAKPAPQPAPNMASMGSSLPGMPTEHAKVSAVPKPTDESLLSGMPASGGTSKIKKILGIVSGALIVAALAFGYYQFFVRPNSANQPADQAAVSNSVPINTQPAAPVSQIPDAWRIKYFGAAVCTNQDNCADNANPDNDGLTNLEEYQNNTDPNNPDNDSDGLAEDRKSVVLGKEC